ncbi:MAG: hypothetical protein AB7P34_11000 [Vicinamibacterales bacterium]
MACSDDNDTPTSPTQPGPPVAEPAPPPPAPDPEPEPTPPPTDDRPIVTITGGIANLSRSGPNGLDVQFRIDDFTIVRAGASTPVVSGSTTGDTSYIRSGMTLTVEGRRTNGFLDATRVTIVSPAP